MARWRKKADELHDTDRLIRAKPGLTAAQIARELGVARSTITRRLPTMEEAGFLYSEDEKGRLWPFKRENR